MRRSVGFARSFVRDRASGARRVDDVVMTVSELVANAVTHTASGREGGRVTVVLLAGDGMYRLEVVDGGGADGRPHVREEVGAETGRGMRIVAALASSWGFRRDGARTVVWAEFPGTVPAPVPDRGDRGRDPFSAPG
ncbi:ATP-binding protein [Actinomadura pelletieri]|uniref:ATP-binding protein n=1 Tax=Actinomadura pelletieri TaxID=111805 RepID=UPI0014772129|nr:ATP-binding protein [Actinomadura pelletieri]